MTPTEQDKMSDEERINKQIQKRANKFRKLHPKLRKKDALYMVLDEMFDDLPDGAYFAAMAEYGFEGEDIIDCNERVQRLGFYK